jgi:signal peptidase II
MCFIIILIIIDQLVKSLSMQSILQNFTVIDYFIKIRIIDPVYNDGMALSMLNTCPSPIIIAISMALIYIIHKYIYSSYLSYILMMSGSISNLIDRLWYGHVIDMIQMSLFNYHLFICNIADIYLTFAVVVMIYNQWNSHND